MHHGFSLKEWLTTTNHKRIGILYIITAVFFLIVAGSLGMLMRVQLAAPNENFLDPFQYDQVVTLHGLLMILWVLTPLGSWISKLHCATPNRSKRLGVSTFKRYKLLDVPFQRSTPCRHSVSSQRRTKYRLDSLRTTKYHPVFPSTRSNTCHFGIGITCGFNNHGFD